MQNDIGDFFIIGYYYLCYLLFEVYCSKSFGRIVYFQLKPVLQTDFCNHWGRYTTYHTTE